MSAYNYIESGLTNVFIHGLEPTIDDDGDQVIEIPFVAALHAEIARGIVEREGQIDGPELRFLRTEMGLTQSQLAKMLDATGQTVGRWERDEVVIPALPETIIRRLAVEKLLNSYAESIEELVRLSQADDDACADRSINITAQGNGYALEAA